MYKTKKESTRGCEKECRKTVEEIRGHVEHLLEKLVSGDKEARDTLGKLERMTGGN
ncbi:TPA: hypothetical protein QCR51_005608 [Bacillus cereus]|nr:hypothetical protein [Bacillus cereus]